MSDEELKGLWQKQPLREPAIALSDLNSAMNSNSLAENSRSASMPRSGHFSHGTFRPEGGGTAAAARADAADMQPGPGLL